MKSDQDALASSHQLLLAIFRHAAATALPCGDGEAGCPAACIERKACLHKAREAFHRVLFALIGHFGREDRLIRHVISPEAFAHHAAGHAAIADAIQAAINDFGRNQDVPGAFRNIGAIGRQYADHHASQDGEYLGILAVRSAKS